MHKQMIRLFNGEHKKYGRRQDPVLLWPDQHLLSCSKSSVRIYDHDGRESEQETAVFWRSIYQQRQLEWAFWPRKWGWHFSPLDSPALAPRPSPFYISIPSSIPCDQFPMINHGHIPGLSSARLAQTHCLEFDVSPVHQPHICRQPTGDS